MGETNTQEIKTEEFPVELYRKLTGFFKQYIGSRGLYGVNYAVFFKEDMASIKACAELKEEIKSYGYTDDQVFRVCQVSNGFVFDMDRAILDSVINEITETATEARESNQKPSITPTAQGVYTGEVTKLAKQCRSALDKGYEEVEVAIYSLSDTPQIILPCLDENNEPIFMYYNAYMLTLWDLVVAQQTIFLDLGLQILKAEICEILPHKKGVRVILHLVNWDKDSLE